jgi:hypothetical protein
MKTTPLYLATMFQFIISFFANATPVCPNLELGETALDCPWAKIARSIPETATSSDVIKKIRKSAPKLLVDLKKDRFAQTRWLNYWGVSRNADESNLNEAIVADPILLALAEQLGFETRPVQNAGLIHTYGYLFSILKTPYGYKRSRYVSGEIETGFELPALLFNGQSESGSLLSQFTYFLSRITFDFSLEEEKTLISDLSKSAITPALSRYPYHELKRDRLIENVKTTAGDITLITDIVKFKTKTQNNSALLIYSIQEGLRSRKLITAFPVNDAFSERLFEPSQLGIEGKTIKLNYNARLISMPNMNPAESILGTGFRIRVNLDGKIKQVLNHD